MEVLRTALLLPDSEPEVKVSVMRGLQIVSMMQSYAVYLGPSLLKETKPFIIASRVSDETFAKLCATIRDKVLELENAEKKQRYEYAIQHVEYGAGGVFQNRNNLTDEEFDFACYSLLWFFKSAQDIFALRHRDLKIDNIVVRVLDKAESFLFYNSATETSVTFTSRFVPVVIDYDFASVATTTTWYDRTNVGTRSTAPPRALIAELYARVLTTRKPRVQTEEQQQSYDWWSIGIILFEVAIRPHLENSVYHTLWQERMEFASFAMVVLETQEKADFAGNKVLKDDTRLILEGLFYGMCIKAMVANDINAPKFIPGVYYDKIQRILKVSSAVKRIFTVFDENIPQYMKSLFRQLLSWNDAARSGDFNQWFTHAQKNVPSGAVINILSDEAPSKTKVQQSLALPYLQFQLQ
jgi:serine/threonine protein kinase